MVIYIVLLSYLFIVADAKLQKKKKVFLGFLPMFLLSAFRNIEVGNDTKFYISSYQKYFNEPFLKLPTNIEPGFYILNKIIGFISNGNERAFILLVSFITMLLFAVVIYKNSSNVGLSIFLFYSYYFFFYSLSAIRQYLAMSVAMNGFFSYRKGNKKIGLFILLISFLFHYSSILLIIPIVLINLKPSIKNIIYVSLLSCAVPLFFERIFYFLINNFNRFSYYTYINNFSGRGISVNILLYVFEIVLILFGVYIIYDSNKKQKEINKDIYIYTICILLSLSLYITSISFTMAARTNHYYSFFLIFDIPLLITKINDKTRKFSYIMIKILFFIYCILMLSHNNWYVVPYKFL